MMNECLKKKHTHAGRYEDSLDPSPLGVKRPFSFGTTLHWSIKRL